MESISQQIIGKKLWHIVQAVYYLLHKGISNQKILIDLHSLLKRGKTARKALAKLITFRHHHHSSTLYCYRKIQISGFITPTFRTVDKGFDFLNTEISDAVSVAALPSPFLKREDSQVDRKAEEFIRRFYEQLSLQQQVAATPEYGCRRRGDVVGRP